MRPSTNIYLPFHKASVRSFGGLKIKFLKDIKTLGYNIVVRLLKIVTQLLNDC